GRPGEPVPIEGRREHDQGRLAREVRGALQSSPNVPDFLLPPEFSDRAAPCIVAFARQAAGDESDEVTQAVRLYYAVRGGIVYTPYCDFRSLDTFRASAVLARGDGFCVGKAAVLAAVARASGIPARVGLADVRNHLCTPRLRALVGGDVFY